MLSARLLTIAALVSVSWGASNVPRMDRMQTTSRSGAENMTGTWDITARFSIEGGPGDGQSTDMKAVLMLAEKDRKLSGTFTPYEADGKTPQP